LMEEPAKALDVQTPRCQEAIPMICFCCTANGRAFKLGFLASKTAA
jgi:hypothetical protein